MTDPLLRLRELPKPTVEPALSAKVLTSAYAILEQPRPLRVTRPGERVLWALVAALSVLHGVWTVGFLNWVGG